MTHSRKRRAILGLIAAAAMAPAAIAQGQGPLSGMYQAQGMNANGSKYGGTVEITQFGSAVTMKWSIGSDTFQGAGTYENRVVSVNWGDQHPVVYVLMPDGSLHGTWANGTALEKLTRQ